MNDNKKNDTVNNSKTIDMLKSTTGQNSQGISRQPKKQNISDDKLYEILMDLKSKVSNNPAIDNISSKTDRLEDHNKILQTEMAEVRESLYDHDEGIYARLKNLENQKILDIKDLEAKMSSNQQNVQKNSEELEKILLKIEKIEDERVNHKKSIDLTVSELNIWKTNVDSMLRWIIITCATAFSSLIGKIVWDLLFKP